MSRYQYEYLKFLVIHCCYSLLEKKTAIQSCNEKLVNTLTYFQSSNYLQLLNLHESILKKSIGRCSLSYSQSIDSSAKYSVNRARDFTFFF